MEISQKSESIIEKDLTSTRNSQNSSKVEWFVNIINIEILRTAIIANINYQFQPDQSWKTRVQTIFNDLFENRDNQSDESQFIRYYYFGQLLKEMPRQHSRKLMELQREMAQSKGVTSIRRYFLLGKQIYQLLKKCELEKAYNF